MVKPGPTGWRVGVIQERERGGDNRVLISDPLEW